MQIYRVGGAVRDRLLGLPVKDTDWVVVGASTEQMLNDGFRQVGRDFPVFLHPDTHEEYALARTERKSGKGYTGFTVHADPDVTLEEDLLRRDLTINAIAEAADGSLIDPFDGQRDIECRVLRHVSPAFAEDPLRVLRVARFAARFAPLGFTIAEETLALMRTITDSGELEHLVAERVWQETSRALGEAQPTVYFDVLRQCGALAVLFPEVDRLFGVPQSVTSHPEIDTGEHTFMVLEQAVKLSVSVAVRFAALTHDIGKGLTPREQWPSHPGHEEAGANALKALCKRMKVPNECADLARLVTLHHGQCHSIDANDAENLMSLLEACDAFRKPERFDDFLLACEADSRGRSGFEEQDYPQATLARSGLFNAMQVETKALIAQDFSGPELGTALRQARFNAIYNDTNKTDIIR